MRYPEKLTQTGANPPSKPAGEPIFDIEELKVQPRNIVVAGILLLVIANYLTWMDVDIEIESDVIDDYNVEEKLKGGSDDDTRDAIDNAGLLFYLSLIGTAVICLRRAFAETYIGEGNYPQIVMVLGAILILLAWSCYSEVKEQVEDYEDVIDNYKDQDSSIDINGGADIGYGIYLALVGPVLVMFGGYQIYREDQKQQGDGDENKVFKAKAVPTMPPSPVGETEMTPQPNSVSAMMSEEAEIDAEITTKTEEQENVIVDDDSNEGVITENPYSPGTTIFHSHFGQGTVISSRLEGEDYYLEIEFIDGKQRTLNSSYVDIQAN